MDKALSSLISAGITAFGVWIIGYTVASGSPLGLDAHGNSVHNTGLDQPLSGSR